MPDITTTKLYAMVSTAISGLDNIAYDTMANVSTSAFFGTFAEMLLKLGNRITVPSCTLVSGGSSASVAIGFPTVLSGNAGLEGLYHFVPWRISAAGTYSGDPSSALNAITASQMDTTSVQIRRVLVCLSLGDISAVQSSIASTVGTFTFVNGSAYTVSVALAASHGGVSAWFNQVPLPKYSGGLIPVGVINIANSYTSGDPVSNRMINFRLREVYGFDLSAIIGQPVQP